MAIGINTAQGRSVVIVDGIRTPFAKAGAALAHVPAAELGQLAVREILARTELDPSTLDEVVLGNCGTPADAANIARVSALEAGVPRSVSAFTVHRNCASGIESIAQAYYKIAAGVADAVVAGGTESMSEYPLLFGERLTEAFAASARGKTLPAKAAPFLALRPKDLGPRIAIAEGLTDPVCGLNMGETAEVLAREFGISRVQQDEFALRSHQRTIAAWDEGRMAEEVFPVYPAPGFEPVAEDVGPRRGQTMEQLGKLKPFFDRRHGTVTVGNSCPITDGAAAVLVMDEEAARAQGYKPLGRLRSVAFAGLDPERMGLGPVFATPVALDRAGLTMRDIALVEINEAFAAQVIANLIAFESNEFAREKLGRERAVGAIDPEKLNVNGGAIALGHPVGVSGTRLVITLLRELWRRGGGIGLATLCVGGGQGAAMIVESLAEAA
ncbi:MAG: thiolase family protein [Candidatus Eiseniibacteriota bacterium]